MIYLADGTMFCVDDSTTYSAYKFRNNLLDHDEFITSANQGYTVGQSVPLVSAYTGFSSLKNGVDYYINSTATGVVEETTFQKVGKAISDTTILK